MGAKILAKDGEKGKIYVTPQGNVIKLGDMIEDAESVNYGKRKVTVMEGEDKGKTVTCSADTKLTPKEETKKASADDELEELPPPTKKDKTTSSKKTDKKVTKKDKKETKKKDKPAKVTTGKKEKRKRSSSGNSQKQLMLNAITEADTKGITEEKLKAVMSKAGTGLKGERLDYAVVYMVSQLRTGRFDGTKRNIVKENGKYYLRGKKK